MTCALDDFAAASVKKSDFYGSRTWKVRAALLGQSVIAFRFVRGGPSGSAARGRVAHVRLGILFLKRARDSGADIELLEGESPARILAECDAVIALTWPPFETPLTPALAGMAAGKPVVAMEIEATAHWPALDPQTWRARGLAATAAPIAVTIEPRDEEHSLMLAMRRLATDPALREQLGRAGYSWWQAHATPAHAAAAWNPILQEAGSLTPPLRPSDWPKHLGADGTELARAILNEFGLTSDI